MNRRSFMLGTAGLAISSLWSHRLSAAAKAEQNPSFDPSYAALPTLEEQTKNLDAEALAAQTKPRTVNGLPVTGLPTKLGKVDEEITAMMKNAGMIGSAVAIAVDRKLMVTRGYGHLSTYDKLPVRPTNPGYLGSITKPLCAMAGLTLIKAGKLKLDQKVVDILPMEPLLKPSEKRQPEIDHITVRMLMNHTSGLFNVVEDLFDRPYYNELAVKGKLELVHGDISQYDLVRRGMSVPFVAKPGTAFNYSGQGMQVLGRIIEKLSGQRLDKYIAAKVLEPLGVKHHATMSYLEPSVLAGIDSGMSAKSHTFIPAPYMEVLKTCATWHFAEPMEQLYGNHWGQADACGSSMLSVIDLLRFVTFCTDLLDKDLEAEALTPPKRKPFSNGLGWGVSMTSGHHQYGHSGAWGGIRAFCESTWDNVQYAVLCAFDQDPPFDKLTERVLELGRSLRDKKAAAVGWQKYGE